MEFTSLALSATRPRLKLSPSLFGRRWDVKKRIAVLAFVLCGAASAMADGVTEIRSIMHPYEEVPSVSSVASGTFSAEINEAETSVAWKLSYKDLEGTVTQAHIHFGDIDVNGGISVWLCSNLTAPPTPPGVQPCPAPPAEISGTFTAVDVVGPAAQGIDAGQLAELIAAIKAKLTYSNVHSTRFPGGEARGQIGIARKSSSPSHDH